ncbi:MAG: extracellular solute-binding protein, partial [Candidatus Bathyarchaeia archaeon]
LDDWVKKYDPEFDHGSCPVAPVKVGYANLYKGHVVGFNTDYDIWLAHRRTDIFEDPEEQKAFESEFGYPLHPPDTWAEYHDFAKFFHRPEQPNPVSGTKGFWGVQSYRLTYFSKWEVEQRYVTKGKLWFDDEMNPTVNTPEFREVFREMDAVAPYIFPGSWSMIWTDVYASFASGEFGYNFSWTSMGKYTQNPAISKIYQWVGAALPPGTPMTAAAEVHPHESAVYGERTESNATPDVRRCAIVSFDWSYAVAKYGKHPELAYLFAQWFTSPVQMTVNAADLAAYFEPFRTCHWMSPLTIEFFNPEFMRKEYYNLEWTAVGLHVPGGAELTSILDKHAVAIMKKEESVDAGLKAIEEGWKDVVDRMGREKLMDIWQHVKQTQFGRNLILLTPDEFKGIDVPPMLPPYKVAEVPGSREYFEATRE